MTVSVYSICYVCISWRVGRGWGQRLDNIYIYSRRAAAGSARTKVTRCHMFLLFFFLLLLLLLLQVKYFKSKTSKNTVFSDMFMPLELYIDEKNTGIYDVCAASRAKNRPKTLLFTLFFSECVENTAFCDVFSTRGFKCTANTMVFFIFFTSSSQSKPTKNTGIYSVLTRQHAKKEKQTTLQAVFHKFSARAPPFKKRSFFTPFLPPFIRTQEGAKNRAKLLNWT